MDATPPTDPAANGLPSPPSPALPPVHQPPPDEMLKTPASSGPLGGSPTLPPDDSAASATRAGPEVYIGLITPLGVTTDDLVTFLTTEFNHYGYESHEIRLSSELEARGATVSSYPDERSRELIRRGNEIVNRYGGDTVIRLGLQRLHAERVQHWSSEQGADLEKATRHVPRRVWIFRSLKRTDEVLFLRKTYGNAFYALAVHASYDRRLRSLEYLLAAKRPSWQPEQHEQAAQELIEIDQSEDAPGGQNVRQAFPMADVILDGNSLEGLEHDARRFVRLLFGENEVPSRHEHGMVLASSSAALSASLSRKVGATLATVAGDIIAVGTNEVAKAGGGQYGAEDSSGRDKEIGSDYSTIALNSLVANTLSILTRGKWLSEEKQSAGAGDLDQLTADAVTLLREHRADILNLIEFQRSVHAEVSAILSAARRGISTHGSVLYTTTYPCHLCAKEIVAAGVAVVYWIEPYPKSRAEAMFGESIAELPSGREIPRVVLTPFIGVTPRAYPRLFTVEEEYRRKSVTGEVERPSPKLALPRVGLLSPLLDVPAREQKAVASDDLSIFRFGLQSSSIVQGGDQHEP
jgi:deoxycytidylate deaminase